MLFPVLLRHLVKKGTLKLLVPDGKKYIFGSGTPEVSIRLHNQKLLWTLGLDPDLRVPEAYRNGTLTIEDGDIRDFLALIGMNYTSVPRSWVWKIFAQLPRLLGWLGEYNPVGRARRNVAFHYDLSSKFYDLFLDKDRQYSCAYFHDGNTNLEQAQYDKKCHIASKLLLDREGLKVLDIGCGWGGLGLYLAQETGADVTGVTLSVEQYKIARERVQATGMSRLCRFKLMDYRLDENTYDRIVSVGMFEHVGKKNYDEFFARIKDLLNEDGVCLLHSIGHLDGPGTVNPFIHKYIFPGTDLPALSEVTKAAERSGLYMTDIEILRLHYAETLHQWYNRFQKNRAKAVAIYGEDFCRAWELYLAGCEAGFRYQGLMVLQLQLSKKLEAVPLTRDYMYEWEHEHAARLPLISRQA